MSIEIKSYDGAVYLAHGELSPEAFCAAVEQQWGVTLAPADVRVGYVRNIPAHPDDCEYSHYFVADAKPGRGAFLATWSFT